MVRFRAPEYSSDEGSENSESFENSESSERVKRFNSTQIQNGFRNRVSTKPNPENDIKVYQLEKKVLSKMKIPDKYTQLMLRLEKECMQYLKDDWDQLARHEYLASMKELENKRKLAIDKRKNGHLKEYEGNKLKLEMYRKVRVEEDEKRNMERQKAEELKKERDLKLANEMQKKKEEQDRLDKKVKEKKLVDRQKKEMLEREKEEQAKAVRLKKEQVEREEKQRADMENQYLVDYKHRMGVLEEIEKSIEPIVNGTLSDAKTNRIAIRKMVGEACNQISSKPSSIRMVVEKLTALLTKAKGFGGPYPAFAMNLIAIKLTSRIRVITTTGDCFPLGHVITMTSIHTPEIAPIILGHLNKLCPYTIPYIANKKSSQSIVEYKKSVGFEFDDEASQHFETFESYANRMKIGVALFAAICQTQPWHGEPQAEALTIDDLCTWLSTFLHQKPLASTASILLSMLEVAAYQLLQSKGQSFYDSILHIENDLYPRLQKDGQLGTAAAAVQLKLFLTQFHENQNQFVEPSGRVLQESQVSEESENATENNNYSKNTSFGSRSKNRRGRGHRR